MAKTQTNQPAANTSSRFEKPLTTVDVAIFTVANDALQVLLVKRANAPDEPFPNRWALPGGFVDVNRDATLEDCALRKLKEKTGVISPYLEQLGSWGSASRDPRGWSATHAYFALIPAVSSDSLTNGANAADAQWMPVTALGVKETLAFDHKEILAAAVTRLRAKVEYTSLPAFLLPKEFTLSELQRVYEIVLERKLEKSAFRTRVLATDLVTETPRFREGANRPAQLYKLRSASKPVFFQRTFKPADD
ncbi:MAG: NUDIX domain-containing protein [Usitatibacteraceae bacterium]